MGVMCEEVTQVLIPAAALIGIGFALLQWFLVSKVRVSGDSDDYDHEYKGSLIDEAEFEEGVDGLEASIKCAEIQNAIAVECECFAQQKMVGSEVEEMSTSQPTGPRG